MNQQVRAYKLGIQAASTMVSPDYYAPEHSYSASVRSYYEKPVNVTALGATPEEALEKAIDRWVEAYPEYVKHNAEEKPKPAHRVRKRRRPQDGNAKRDKERAGLATGPDLSEPRQSTGVSDGEAKPSTRRRRRKGQRAVRDHSSG